METIHFYKQSDCGWSYNKCKICLLCIQYVLSETWLPANMSKYLAGKSWFPYPPYLNSVRYCELLRIHRIKEISLIDKRKL